MGRTTGEAGGMGGAVARLYDVFVDWPGRLGRELPGIERHLGAVGARRVLDVGCGTGRHVQALLERGFDAHGADASEEMLAQGRALTEAPERFHTWRLGDPPGATLRGAGPFDAVFALGNVWPFALSEEQVLGACGAFRRLVRPGGLVLLGLKAHGVRQLSGDPYMPLLRREHGGRRVWFVRFVEFDVPPLEDGTQVCEVHLSIVAGGSEQALDGGEAEAVAHTVLRQRVWRPGELGRWFEDIGFLNVRVAGSLQDPSSAPEGEDVFLSAIVPAGGTG